MPPLRRLFAIATLLPDLAAAERRCWLHADATPRLFSRHSSPPSCRRREIAMATPPRL